MFDPDLYLQANPDVAKAVESGAITAELHYEKYGKHENRLLIPRNHYILKHINKSSPGVEIGPSHNPIAPKAMGYNVHIIDHLDQAGLREKYKAHTERIPLIEEVDFIWKGENYSDLTGKSGYYDWIIASHLIEHTPDLIGFLLSCGQILTGNGKLLLAIPDKNFCFDHFRHLSSLASIIDAHHLGRKFHSVGTALEYFLYYTRKNNEYVWNAEKSGGAHTFPYTMEYINEIKETISMGLEYVDMHSWVFTPKSFAETINLLNMLDLQPFVVESVTETIDYEFFACLTKCQKAIVNRQEIFLGSC